MLQNRLKVAYRSLVKDKLFFGINLFGLSIGITCSLLVLLYVQDERAYDQHHERGDRIYRLGAEYTISGQVDRYANVPRPIGPTLQQDYPEIEQYARIRPLNMITNELILVSRPDETDLNFAERHIVAADSTVFDLFTFPFIQGNPQTALNGPNKAILTERMAQKLYGDEDPIGQQISINNQTSYEVTGIVQDPPHSSHFQFDIMVSWATFHAEADLQRWIGGHVYTYVLFPENHDVNAFLAKWPAFFDTYMKGTFDRFSGSFDLILQPLRDIHLHSDLQWEYRANGNVTSLYFLSVIGLFILIIACINYTNMATVQATSRAKEVGVRKVMGAHKKTLVRQFLSESLLMAFLSLIVSGLLIALVLPVFNELADKAFRFYALLANPLLVLSALGITLLVGLFSGLYPAFYLSKLLPISALRGTYRTGKKRALFRQALTTTQFAISVIIIISTLVVYDQLDYTRSKGLGFDKDHVLVVNLWGDFTEDKLLTARNALLQHPDILKTAASPNVLGEALNHTAFEIEVTPGEWLDQSFQFLEMDHDFIDLMGMQVVDGRSFDRAMATDSTQAVMINEATVQEFGWDDPVGKRVRFPGSEQTLEVIGVVEDFHAGSLHHTIEPVVMWLAGPENGKLYIKMTGNNLLQTLDFVEATWAELEPDFPIDYTFLDANLERLYSADIKLGQIFGYCAVIAILIACLGLIGLTAFTTAQRAKEIGTRKVLGASIGSIVTLLSRQFVLIVIVANVMAWPAAYFLMEAWLQNFAYQTSLSVMTFLVAGLVVFLIGLGVVSFQSIKAAVANPVDVLRYE